MESFLSAARDYFSGFVQDYCPSGSDQSSLNSISVHCPILLEETSTIVGIGLVTFLKKNFPKYNFELNRTYSWIFTWGFVISHYPLVELPLDIIRKIFIHAGPAETVWVLREIPELRKTLTGEHFWYEMMVEQYPDHRKIPKELVDWKKFCQEVSLLSKKNTLTFDLPLLKEAVRKNASEVVKVILQDSRLDLPSIRSQPRRQQGWIGMQGLRGPQGAVGPEGPRLYRKIRLIFKEMIDTDRVDKISDCLHNLMPTIKLESGETLLVSTQYHHYQRSLAILKIQNAGGFKYPDPVLILWEDEDLFVFLK